MEMANPFSRKCLRCCLSMVQCSVRPSWGGKHYRIPVAYPGILFGGVQQIKLKTEDRENGDLGAVAP